MQLQTLFSDFRQANFFDAASERRKDLAYYLAQNNESLEAIIARLENDDATGKNEVIAKIYWLTGGRQGGIPHKYHDAINQFGRQYSLAHDARIRTGWQELLVSYQEQYSKTHAEAEPVRVQ